MLVKEEEEEFSMFSDGTEIIVFYVHDTEIC